MRLHRDVVALADDFVRHHLDFLAHFIVATAHEALDGVNRVLRVGDRLALGHLADEAFAGLGDGYDGRRGAPAFLVGDYDRLAALHDGNDGVGSPEVNSDNLAH